MLGKLVNYYTPLHQATRRAYIDRMVDEKVHCMLKAKEYEADYWDGDRRFGYGGYNYLAGWWKPVAEELIKNYNLTNESSLLDVGCGKGYLLFDFLKVIPDAEIFGIDISNYAIENSKKEIRKNLQTGNATELPWPDNYFDLVYSINTFHNLHNYDLDKALREFDRVGKNNKYICVESYRTEEEKTNLLYWQVTCESFCTPEEWEWWFKNTGYKGDHSFIYFD